MGAARERPERLPLGQRVRVEVVNHFPFGLGVRVLDRDAFGYVCTPWIKDGPIEGMPDFPPVGRVLDAVVVAYTPSGQLRLWTRPSMLPPL